MGKHIELQNVKMGYFVAPDAIFVKNLSLSSTERLLYLYLCRRSNALTTSYPSYQQMADDTGLSRTTCIRAIQVLEQGGFLLRSHRRIHQNKEFSHNTYQLLPFPSVTRENTSTNFNVSNDTLIFKESVINFTSKTLQQCYDDTTWTHEKTTIFKDSYSKDKEEDDLPPTPQGDIPIKMGMNSIRQKTSHVTHDTSLFKASAWGDKKLHGCSNVPLFKIPPDPQDDCEDTDSSVFPTDRETLETESWEEKVKECQNFKLGNSPEYLLFGSTGQEEEENKIEVDSRPRVSSAGTSAEYARQELYASFAQVAVALRSGESMPANTLSVAPVPPFNSEGLTSPAPERGNPPHVPFTNDGPSPTLTVNLAVYQAIEEKMRGYLRPDYSLRELHGEIQAAKELLQKNIPLSFILDSIDFTFTHYGVKYRPNSFAYAAKVCLTRYEIAQETQEPIEKGTDTHKTRPKRKTREKPTEPMSAPYKGIEPARNPWDTRKRPGSNNLVRVAQGSQAQWNDQGQDQRYAGFYALFPGETP